MEISGFQELRSHYYCHFEYQEQQCYAMLEYQDILYISRYSIGEL